MRSTFTLLALAVSSCAGTGAPAATRTTETARDIGPAPVAGDRLDAILEGLDVPVEITIHASAQLPPQAVDAARCVELDLRARAEASNGALRFSVVRAGTGEDGMRADARIVVRYREESRVLARPFADVDFTAAWIVRAAAEVARRPLRVGLAYPLHGPRRGARDRGGARCRPWRTKRRSGWRSSRSIDRAA